jgi:hypothetical protein
MLSNKKCISDNECDNNQLCSFNYDDYNNYCIKNDINELYYGCINDNVLINLDSIEKKTNNDDFDYLKCIDFSRRQINKDGLNYNYMVYKPKKKSFVDTTTINIYLKCNEEILSVIPYDDYFNLSCDNNQENCILTSKNSLLNFIKQNSRNCNKKLHLDIYYECENEGIKKNLKVYIDINNFSEIKINLKCPIDETSDKFKSKCQAIYIDQNAINKNNYKELIDINKTLNDCKNPIFKVPVIVNDISNYKKVKSSNSNNEIKEYDLKINKQLEDLRKLEAEKYIKLKKIQTGKTLSLQQAYEELNKKSFNKILANSKEKWKVFKNYDAAINIFPHNEHDKILTYYGKVYTLEDAINIAIDKNQNYFVYYHNSYELDDFASKLYFIDIFYNDTGLLKKSNWVSHENVSTCIAKDYLEFILDGNVNDDNDNNIEDINKLKEIFESSSNNNEELQERINLINSFDTSEALINSVIKDLNNKITTYGQAISMNNYETNINNKILTGLVVITFLMFVIFIVLMVYFNNKSAGKIKLLGMKQ